MQSASTRERQPLLPPSTVHPSGEEWHLIRPLQPPEGHVAWGEVAQRWYILGLFFLLTANQCLFWFTFSSVPDEVQQYYGWGSTATIDLLLNWGPLTFVPSVPFVSYVLASKSGLRRAMRSAAVLSCLGCLIRLIPCFLGETRRKTVVGQIPLHVGQILNGVAGPILIAAPSRLSAVWFPPAYRARVTAVANSSLFGAAIGFWLGPAVAKVPSLLYITAGLSIVPLVAALTYCPAAPAKPPSEAVTMSDIQVGGIDFVRGALQILWTQPSMVALMAVTAGGVGTYDAWIGVLPQILNKVNVNDGASTAIRENWPVDLNGWAGLTHTFACITGCWVAGALADKFFQRQFRVLLVVLFAFASSLLLWVSCMLDGNITPFAKKVPRSTISVFAIIGVLGFVRSAAIPILYEAAAELTYPVPEGTSAGLIVIAEHVTLLSLLFVAPHVQPSSISLACIGALAACVPILLLSRLKYKRLDAERALAAKQVN